MALVKTPLYWRLSAFYFFYFASIGTLIPYWGLYLQSQGFGAQQIAFLIAIIMGTKIIAPNIWGWIADHTGRRIYVIRIASFFTIICFLGVFISLEYLWLTMVMIAFSFFWNANLPQFEALTLNHLGKDTNRYSSIRLWGSFGFVLLVVILGVVFENYGVELFPWIFTLLLIGIWACSFLVKDQKSVSHDSTSVSLLTVLKQPRVSVFLLICFLLQASHGPYYAFYSIYLEQHSYSRTLIGQLWALGVIAEIVIFLVMHQLLPKYGVRTLLVISLILTGLRWLMIGYFVEWFPALVIAQCFHAASFGVFHAVAIFLIHQYFPGSVQGRGQALYSSLSFGAGGAVGAIYSGYTWEGLGPTMSFNIAAIISFAAVFLAYSCVKKETGLGGKL